MDPRKIIRKLFPTCRRLLVEKSLKLLTSNEYDNVLVLGAGYDPYRKYFSYNGLYTCLDIENYCAVTNIVADVHKLPISSGCIDCIVAIELFEHVQDPFTFIKQVENTLMHDGVLIISVPFMYHFHADPFDFWRPSRLTINNLLKGFSEVKIYSQGNRLHSIVDLISTAFSPVPVLFPLRIFSHLFCFGPLGSIILDGKTTAPSGYFIVAKK